MFPRSDDALPGEKESVLPVVETGLWSRRFEEPAFDVTGDFVAGVPLGDVDALGLLTLSTCTVTDPVCPFFKIGFATTGF